MLFTRRCLCKMLETLDELIPQAHSILQADRPYSSMAWRAPWHQCFPRSLLLTVFLCAPLLMISGPSSILKTDLHFETVARDCALYLKARLNLFSDSNSFKPHLKSYRIMARKSLLSNSMAAAQITTTPTMAWSSRNWASSLTKDGCFSCKQNFITFASILKLSRWPLYIRF